jgi:hypothetical protein
MANDEAMRVVAVAKQQEPIFLTRVIGIVDQAGALIQKNYCASWNETPCLIWLDRALRRSQANSILPIALY